MVEIVPSQDTPLPLVWTSATPSPVGGTAPVAAVHASVHQIPRAHWNELCRGAAENHEFYAAIEAAPPAGFSLGAMTVRDGGRLVAAAPLFRTSYRLDTPFQGAARAIADRVHALVPRLTALPVLGIGSPASDNCSLGFAEGLTLAGRRQALARLLGELDRVAREEKAAIVAVKSLAEDAALLEPELTAAGYGRVTSVPVVMLPLPYVSLEHYLASLPDGTGSYLRRKLRSLPKLRIEYRDTAAGLEPRLNALYEATLAQSAVAYGDFDGVNEGYFTALLDEIGPRARLMLCWKGDELVSFQVFLIGSDRIIANKIGMKYPDARELNLYFVNWLKMIELAIELGVPEIEMGATTYAAKLLFGGRIEKRWLHFRFVNGLVNRLARPLHHVFDFESNDPELQRLKAAKT